MEVGKGQALESNLALTNALTRNMLIGGENRMNKEELSSHKALGWGEDTNVLLNGNIKNVIIYLTVLYYGDMQVSGLDGQKVLWLNNTIPFYVVNLCL